MSPWVLGVHLLSLHAPDCWVASSGACVPYEKATVGLYAVDPKGRTAGVFSNSYGETAGYVGMRFETEDRRFALTVAGVVGYRQATVLPVIVPSMRIALTPSLALRLHATPKPPGEGAALLHVSIEGTFR